MAHALYRVTAEWDAEARAWSILAPDFPEIASAATSADSIAQTASDAIETAIELRREHGESLPERPSSVGAGPAPDMLLVYVPVRLEEESETVRVNVSLGKRLLERIDGEAGRRGMTRSSFLAEGARSLLRS